MRPRVKEYRYFGIRESLKFPFSVNILLDYARKLDRIGKKSQWWMKSSSERVIASNIYRKASQYAFMIYG
jgi:hypothetical protein